MKTSIALLLLAVLTAGCAQAQRPERALPGFDTNTARRTIDLDELRSGERRVVNDSLGGVPVVILHTDGATTALGEARIAQAREVGTTGAFDRRLTHDGETRRLTFEADGDRITDAETGSTRTVTGEAVAGPLAGARLTPLRVHDTFAFAWFAFRPETTIYGQP